MKVHKIRSFVAALVAIILVILLAAVATAAMGMDLPILGDIARAIGMGG